MNRINTICSFITENDKVVDVGCDQVEVGLALSKRSIKSIACDISEKVIERANKKIELLKLKDYIDLRVSNGLQNIKENEADTLVLAGMGTHTIIDILSNTNLKFKKIITISNNYHDILRQKMNELNYKVKKELIIEENDIFYNLILFVPGNKKYTEKDILLGLNHIKNPEYYEYMEFLRHKYYKLNKLSNGKYNKIVEFLKDI